MCVSEIVRSLLLCLAIGCGPSATESVEPEATNGSEAPPATEPSEAPSAEPEAPEPESAGPVREASIALAGACLVPHDREYIIEVTSREAHPPPDREEPEPRRHALRTLRDFDLDGDGTMDVFVPTLEPNACLHDVTYAMYVVRGDCGHDVGTLRGRPQLSEGETDGLRNLEGHRRWAAITDANSPPGPNNVATLWEVTTPYVAREAHYASGDPRESSGICHHCGIPECRILSGPSQ